MTTAAALPTRQASIFGTSNCHRTLPPCSSPLGQAKEASSTTQRPTGADQRHKWQPNATSHTTAVQLASLAGGVPPAMPPRCRWLVTKLTAIGHATTAQPTHLCTDPATHAPGPQPQQHTAHCRSPVAFEKMILALLFKSKVNPTNLDFNLDCAQTDCKHSQPQLIPVAELHPPHVCRAAGPRLPHGPRTLACLQWQQRACHGGLTERPGRCPKMSNANQIDEAWLLCSSPRARYE